MSDQEPFFDVIKPRLLPIEQWHLGWRFEEASIDVPQHHLQQMHCLSREDAGALWKLIIKERQLHEDFPFTATKLYFIEKKDISEDSHEFHSSSNNEVKKWLYHCGVPFKQQIYLSYYKSEAIATTWKMLVKYWPIFYYSVADEITAIDASGDWALHLHHEDVFYFGSKEPQHDDWEYPPAGRRPSEHWVECIRFYAYLINQKHIQFDRMLSLTQRFAVSKRIKQFFPDLSMSNLGLSTVEYYGDRLKLPAVWFGYSNEHNAYQITYRFGKTERTELAVDPLTQPVMNQIVDWLQRDSSSPPE